MHHDRVPKELQPRPVYIEHADGSLVTVKEFVITAHECLSQHKDAVIKNRNFLRKTPLLPIEVPEPEGTDEDVEVGNVICCISLLVGLRLRTAV